MLAKDLISDVVPALKTSDSGLTALNWMEVFRISHLPIINNTKLLGLISDADIYDLNMANEPVGNHSLSLTCPSVKYNQHIYEVINLISKYKLTVVPVIDEDSKYMGLITLYDLLQNFAHLTATQNPGGIIILELNQNDYSLTQIANIIESNDTKILSLYITSPPDSNKMELTIKINKTDISSILQTFNRYNYSVKASYLDDEELNDLYKSRFDQFMRYLNI
ncbi:MAG: CBS domain-containing protein [Chlorobi bacterium]|nr:CBS domain-containing protein [Chlorobiota bacterium]